MAPIRKVKTSPKGHSSKLWYLHPLELYNFAKCLMFEHTYFWMTASILLLAEFVVNVFVIWKIPYTEIDWKAYMSEVEGFLNGTYDYMKLEGATGPLVYPAGFVYLFSGLYFITDKGSNIKLAQCLFAVLYLTMLITIFYIYQKCKNVPPYVMFFICCASYRIHSIFILRLFNDPTAMFFLYLSVCCLLNERWNIGCILFSLGVSIKMNVLLFSPGLAIILLLRFGLLETIKKIILCAAIQLVLAVPFLLENPIGYISRSFNLGRQFFYIWTVNWRLIPETLFLSRWFQVVLLICHIGFLLFFIFRRWPTPEHGWLSVLSHKFRNSRKSLPAVDVISILYVSNFIGMCFARSLHYQFYVWYFHTLPFLLWSIKLPSVFRLLVLGLIEMSWNTYPSTVLSSSVLHVCHFVILVGLILRKSAVGETESKDE